MENRYCIYCGMPISHNAKSCPECGASQNVSAAPDESLQFDTLQFTQEQSDQLPPQKEHPIKSNQQPALKHISLILIGLILFFCVIIFFVFRLTNVVKTIQSRHAENMMDEQRADHPEISLPEFSMPDIDVPVIELPEVPAATFAIDNYEIETNLMGDTVLYVNLNYTNNAESKQCFLTNFQISVQQEGEKCQQTAGDPTKENYLMSYVQPEETAPVSEAFIISPEKETTVTVTAYFSDEIYLEETILPHTNGSISASE